MSVYDDEILQQYEQKQKWGKCISYLTSLVDETNFLDVNIRIFIVCFIELGLFYRSRKQSYVYILTKFKKSI